MAAAPLAVPLGNIPQFAVPTVHADAFQSVGVRRNKPPEHQRDLVVVLHVDVVEPFH